MSWEAIRCVSKMTEQELWHPKRTECPVLLNRITNAAEEAIKLLAERDRAVELLHEIANSNGFTRGQINDSRSMILAPCVFDLDSEGVERLIKFFRALEGKQ